jgi:hypothetical protein
MTCRQLLYLAFVVSCGADRTDPPVDAQQPIPIPPLDAETPDAGPDATPEAPVAMGADGRAMVR